MIKTYDEVFESKYDVDYYLSKVEEIHGNRYEYPLIRDEFKNSSSKISIFCNKCKETFKQSLSHHIWSKSGCSNCFGNKPNTPDKILGRSRIVHGDGRYSYPDLSNVSSNKKINIICNKCKTSFNQTVHSHLNKKNGCVRCSKSKVEQLISNYLSSNNIEYIPQWSPSGCVYKRPLYYDFYLVKYNLCIEYDGEQHFTSRRDDNGDRLKLQKIKDEIKNNFCLKNNINIERITYKDVLSLKIKSIMDKYGIQEICDINNTTSIFSEKKTKICSICKVDKKLDDYNRSSRMMDGRKSYCRVCSSIIGKEFYKNKNKKNG